MFVEKFELKEFENDYVQQSEKAFSQRPVASTRFIAPEELKFIGYRLPQKSESNLYILLVDA